MEATLKVVEGEPSRAESPGGVLEGISNAVVQTMKDRAGKGPTKAKTFLADRYVFVVTQDCLTTAERTLVEAGQFELVREGRRRLHREVAEELAARVESLIGVPVLASETQLVFDADSEIQIFVLGS